MVTGIFFAVVSLAAGILNTAFLLRSTRNYAALLKDHNQDPTLKRIGTGFIYIWIFIIFADLIRVLVGLGVLIHQPESIYLLLLSPIGSFLIAVIGLRSFR